MRFAASISALAFAAVALAQNQTIHVGQDDGTMKLVFNPQFVAATENSVITFVFDGVPGNHSVTQSTFATPCEPAPGGFNSGFVFNAQNGSNLPPATWDLTITNASTPIWFYCAQTNPAIHCTSGMVGAINAPTTGNKTFDAFRSNAVSSASTAGYTAPALSGLGAFATVSPSATGTVPISVEATQSVPSGSGAVPPSSATSNSSGSGSGTGTASATGTGGANSAGTLSTNGFVAALAAVFGVALL